ncbi:MAG: phosphate ABC transporter permease PstA [Promethearchaeota archaeon]|nr:MAG: phosphate ABC transporter permease PstA [Candidatus Lokiarchaeota archaeon]
MSKNSILEEDQELEFIIIAEKGTKDKIIKYFLFMCASIAIIFIFFIIWFLFASAGNFFHHVHWDEFLLEDDWDPTNEDEPKYGALAIIVGTILVTIGALVIAIPLGIGTAIFISQIAPSKMKKFLKGAVELLSGIPSIVFGYFGLIILNVWLMDTFEIDSGNTWLSGSIILAVMALPTIISVSEDAISSVPVDYKEASLAMGATKWQTIKKAILPAALSGIIASIILGTGRALGETMAVLMVTGNTAIVPEPITDIFSSIRTITATIGIEMGEVPSGSRHYQALFALAIVLFIFTFGINTIATLILSRISQKSTGKQKRRKINIKIPQKVKDNKKLIYYSILILFLTWVIASWIGWILALVISITISGLFFLFNKSSAKNQQRFIFSLIYSAAFIVVLALGILIYYLVIRGLPAITWEFLTEGPDDLGRKGGIFPAILGTLLLVVGAIFYSVPIGIAAGIYLAEYAKEGRITRIIRAAIDNLNGVPSIVFGLFGLAFFVFYLGLGISMIAGQLTLGLMILPTIIKTTEESVKSVPQSVREGSLALGSTKWQSISRAVMPAAIPGIITGIILGMGRAAGETAPILFTAMVFQQRYLPRYPTDPVTSLTYHLFILVTSIPDSEAQAAGTALVLLVLVLMLYGIAIYIRNSYQKKIKW